MEAIVTWRHPGLGPPAPGPRGPGGPWRLVHSSEERDTWARPVVPARLLRAFLRGRGGRLAEAVPWLIRVIVDFLPPTAWPNDDAGAACCGMPAQNHLMHVRDGRLYALSASDGPGADGTLVGGADDELHATHDGGALLGADSAGTVRVRVPRCDAVLHLARRPMHNAFVATVDQPGLAARALIIYETIDDGGFKCVDTLAPGGRDVTPAPGRIWMAENVYRYAHAWREGADPALALWVALWSDAFEGEICGDVFSLAGTDGAVLEWHCGWTAAVPWRHGWVMADVRCLHDKGSAWLVVRRVPASQALVALIDLRTGETDHPWERVVCSRLWNTCSVTGLSATGRPVVEFGPA